MFSSGIFSLTYYKQTKNFSSNITSPQHEWLYDPEVSPQNYFVTNILQTLIFDRH